MVHFQAMVQLEELAVVRRLEVEVEAEVAEGE